MELNKIYNEDCMEGMKRIPDASIDLIVTDPPYNTTDCEWEKDKCGNFLCAKGAPLKYTEDILVFSKNGYIKPWNNNGKPKGGVQSANEKRHR